MRYKFCVHLSIPVTVHADDIEDAYDKADQQFMDFIDDAELEDIQLIDPEFE